MEKDLCEESKVNKQFGARSMQTKHNKTGQKNMGNINIFSQLSKNNNNC